MNLKLKCFANAVEPFSRKKYSLAWRAQPTVATTAQSLNSLPISAGLANAYPSPPIRTANAPSASLVPIATACSPSPKIPKPDRPSTSANFATGTPKRSIWRKINPKLYRTTWWNYLASENVRISFTTLLSRSSRRPKSPSKWKINHQSTPSTKDPLLLSHLWNSRVQRTSNSWKKSTESYKI